MNKEEYLQQPCESNEDFVTQQLLMNCDTAQIWAIQQTFAELEKVIYKSWAKEMSFNELKYAIAKAAILADPQKEK